LFVLATIVFPIVFIAAAKKKIPKWLIYVGLGFLLLILNFLVFAFIGHLLFGKK